MSPRLAASRYDAATSRDGRRKTDETQHQAVDGGRKPRVDGKTTLAGACAELRDIQDVPSEACAAGQKIEEGLCKACATGRKIEEGSCKGLPRCSKKSGEARARSSLMDDKSFIFNQICTPGQGLPDYMCNAALHNTEAVLGAWGETPGPSVAGIHSPQGGIG